MRLLTVAACVSCSADEVKHQIESHSTCGEHVTNYGTESGKRGEERTGAV